MLLPSFVNALPTNNKQADIAAIKLRNKIAHSSGGNHTMAFIENKGQLTDGHGRRRPDIAYKLDGTGGLQVFVGSGQLHYQWSKTVGNSQLAVNSRNSSQLTVGSQEIKNRLHLRK